MATHAPLPASVVGNSFVMRYYTVLNSSPDLLHHFYQEQSVCCHGTEGQPSEPVTGMKNIHDKLSSSFPEKGSTVTLSVVDIQESLEGSVIVMVIGSMNTPGRASKRFVQSFVLAKQQPEGFYVRNDMLRYVSEPEGKAEQIGNATGPSSAPSVVPEQRHEPVHAQKPVEHAPAPSATPAHPASTTAQPAPTPAQPAPHPTPAPAHPTPAAKEQAPAPSQAPKEAQPAAHKEQHAAAEKPHAQPEKTAHAPAQQQAPATATTPAPAQTPAPKEAAPQTPAQSKETASKPAPAAEKPAEKSVEKPAAPAAEKPAEKITEVVQVKPTPAPAPAAPKNWASVAAAAAANPAPVALPPPKKDAQIKPATGAAGPAATPAATSGAPAQTAPATQQPPAGATKPQKTKAEIEADSTWVYVNNLPYTTTLESVVKVFSAYGAIKNSESHIPKGYAFIKYDTKEIASAVIEQAKKTPVTMEGRHVTVDWRQTKPVKDRRNKPDKGDRPHKPKPFANGSNGSPKDHPRKPKDNKPQHLTNTTSQASPKPTPAKDHQ